MTVLLRVVELALEEVVSIISVSKALCVLIFRIPDDGQSPNPVILN
jgi:hypothetical protein